MWTFVDELIVRGESGQRVPSGVHDDCIEVDCSVTAYKNFIKWCNGLAMRCDVRFKVAEHFKFSKQLATIEAAGIVSVILGGKVFFSFLKFFASQKSKDNYSSFNQGPLNGGLLQNLERLSI